MLTNDYVSSKKSGLRLHNGPIIIKLPRKDPTATMSTAKVKMKQYGKIMK